MMIADKLTFHMWTSNTTSIDVVLAAPGRISLELLQYNTLRWKYNHTDSPLVAHEIGFNTFEVQCLIKSMFILLKWFKVHRGNFFWRKNIYSRVRSTVTVTVLRCLPRLTTFRIDLVNKISWLFAYNRGLKWCRVPCTSLCRPLSVSRPEWNS